MARFPARPISTTIDDKECHDTQSALPPKADMCGATGNVRYGPIADIAPSNQRQERLKVQWELRRFGSAR